ncbi:hypothetical protein KIN20_013055 [Parelaphostrongylus tenuis]|uniref:Uncharacterized protein n=1 Tax=Parelaphostrongylus tenuis TaxID=148309 RepID=A0AAD5MBI9_PARTN|nr:hypothetical protein KIN20_013055 [Parelaphostrongylus tenuis]
MHLVDFLSTESVQRTSWAFQSVDDIHGSDGLSFRVFTVGGSIRDDDLQKDLEDTTAPDKAFPRVLAMSLKPSAKGVNKAANSHKASRGRDNKEKRR